MWFKKKKEKTVMGWEDLTLDQFTEIEKIMKDDNNAKELRIMDLLYGDKGDISFLNSQPKTVMWKDSYWIAGRKYRLKADMSKFSISQMIDYQSGKNMYDWLAVVLVPNTAKSYNDGSYDMGEVKKGIGKMRLLDALAISNFLKRQCVALSLLMKDFLSQKMREIAESKALTQEQKEQVRSQITVFSRFVSLFAETTI